VEPVEAVLGAPGDLEDVRGLALLAVAESGADPRLAQVVPGGLNQEPARVAGAGLRDRALAARLARLVERRYEPEPGRELGWPLEAGEVADLEAERERGERVDAAEAAQTRDRRPPLALEREPGEPLLERGFASDQPVDRGQAVEVGGLGRRLLEAPA